MVPTASWLSIALAYLGLFAVLYAFKFHLSFVRPVMVEIDDPSYDGSENSANYVCWISPDKGSRNLTTIAAEAPRGCSDLAPGINTKTFVGHQFLFVYNNQSMDNPPKVLTMRSNLTYIDVVSYSNYDTTRDFDFLVEWQRLLLQRRHIASAFAVILLIQLMLTRTTSKENNVVKEGEEALQTNSKRSKKPTSVADNKSSTMGDVREPWVPRQAIKCYAVVNMLVNHTAYTFIRSNKPLQTWFTLWADAGGSMTLFNWLIGYNTQPDSRRNNEIMLLVAFLLLNTCIDLPHPITYETLLSVCLTRWLLQTSLFRVSASDGSCPLAEQSIMINALLIELIVLAGKVLGTEGLKLVHMEGVLYAINGRLFAVRDVPLATRLLWLSAAATTTLQSGWFNFSTAQANAGVLQYAYGAVYVVMTLLNAFVVNGAAIVTDTHAQQEGTDRKTAEGSQGKVVVPVVMQWIARYSLEIYIGHFLVLKALYELLK